MARETINLIEQIGVQTVVGTAVAATKKFSSLMINLSDVIETKQFRSWGAKFTTTSAIHKRWAKGSYSGALSYSEICYVLASLVPFTVSTTGGVSTWDFTPNASGSDTWKVYSLEIGDDEAGELYKDFMFISAECAWTQEDMTISGDCIAKPKATVTLATGIAVLAERPVLRNHVDLYMDTTFGGLGTTKITDPFEMRWSIGEKFEPKWVLNSSESSYREVVEKIPELKLTTVIEANAQGRTLVDDLLANNTGRYIRVASVGGLIAALQNYTINVDIFGKVMDVRQVKDYNGLVYAYEIDWVAVHDESMGRAWKIQVKNALTAL